MDNHKDQNYHHGNVKHELVAAAMLLLADEGIDNISLRRLAREIGISPAAVYNHFENKLQLMTAIKSMALDEYSKFLDENCKTYPEPEKTFEELCKAYVEFSLQHPSLFDVLFNERAVTGFDEIKEIASQLTKSNRLPNALMGLYKKYDIPTTKDRLIRGCLLIWAQLHGLIVLRNSGSILALTETMEWSDSGPLNESEVMDNLISQMTNGLYTTLRLQQEAITSASNN